MLQDYVVVDFSACIAAPFYNSVFNNTIMLNWKVESLPPALNMAALHALGVGSKGQNFVVEEEDLCSRFHSLTERACD